MHRLGRRGTWLALLALPAVTGALAAQAPLRATEACRDALVEQGMAPGDVGDRPCQTLAALVVTTLTTDAYAPLVEQAIRPRDLQSTVPRGPATGGSLAQSDAVPAANPVALAAGSIIAVGSDAGADAIAALGLNPAAFFVDPAERAQVARLTRLLDFSVFVPVDGLDRDEDGDVDYFGVRLRVNATGLSQGDAVMREARRIFGGIVESHAQRVRAIRDALESAPDPAACAAALVADPPDLGAVAASCGTAIDFEVSEERYHNLAAALARARAKADARSFGLDVRADFGDPTLGTVAGAAGTFLFGGVAFGQRFGGDGDDLAMTGVSGRAGVRFASLRDTTLTSFALDGGIGLELRRVYDQQELGVAAALEFRWGGEADLRDRMQSNYVMARASFRVPITGANGVTVSVGAPIVGEISPALTIAADWGLLLPAR